MFSKLTPLVVCKVSSVRTITTSTRIIRVVPVDVAVLGTACPAPPPPIPAPAPKPPPPPNWVFIICGSVTPVSGLNRFNLPRSPAPRDLCTTRQLSTRWSKRSRSSALGPRAWYRRRTECDFSKSPQAAYTVTTERNNLRSCTGCSVLIRSAILQAVAASPARYDAANMRCSVSRSSGRLKRTSAKVPCARTYFRCSI